MKGKAKLPLHQIIFFSMGHILNDVVMAVFSSYLLTFQTKVLGLPNNVVGLLWLIPAGIESMIAIVIGYMSDNVTIPFFSKYYGKRKSMHLIGCAVVGTFAPFILMPCFFCDNNAGWSVVVYYVAVITLAYSGWSLTQANFLALIPEIATRQSDMVKLGAINSAVTLMGGIYVYVITWVLLGNSNDSLSSKHTTEFRNLGIITTGTGAFFVILFHIGTRETSHSILKGRKKALQRKESTDNHTASKKEKRKKSLPPTADNSESNAHAHNMSNAATLNHGFPAHVNPSFEEEERNHDIALAAIDLDENTAADDSGERTGPSDTDTAALKQMLRATLARENLEQRNDDGDDDQFESSWCEDGDSTSLEDDDSSLEGFESVELFMPKTYIDMVPFHSNLILRSRRCSTASALGGFGSRRSSMAPSRTPSRTPSKIYHHSRRTSENIHNQMPFDSRRSSAIGSGSPVQQHRFPSRSASKKYQPSLIEENGSLPNEMFKSAVQSAAEMGKGSPVLHRFPPRTASVKFHPSLATSEPIDENVPQGILCSRQNSKIIRGSPRLNRGLNRDGSKNYITSPLAMGAAYNVHDHDDYTTKHAVRFSITPDQMLLDSVAVENLKSADKKSKSWMLLFKNPVFYKLGFAYMFTRVAQNVTNSYMPIYLTDSLKFDTKAIAYFPLVVLLSGVFASIGGKKLIMLLGNKWTFCLGALLVMGSSGWFYLMTEETRHVTYIPAILSGSGTSVMFVATLALAAEFVDSDRSSGAFVLASMTTIAKLVGGTLFCLLQEYAPQPVSTECPECIEYAHFVFSFTPGVSAFLGLVAFILFIPATIRCTPIAFMEDAETQTDDEPITHSLDVIAEDENDSSCYATEAVGGHAMSTIKESEARNSETIQEDEPDELNTSL